MVNRKNHKRIMCLNNKGATLIEMLVCFVMLAIFLVAAFSIITHISSLYYQVKGETYGKQVSDIIMEKAQSEIEGAKLDGDVILFGEGTAEGDTNKTSGSNITLYDKTNTKVMLYADYINGPSTEKVFKIQYFSFTNNEGTTNANTWKYDKNVYNGYQVSELKFIKGGSQNDETNRALATSYGINETTGYGDDVVVILLTIHSERYGDYKSYRFVRMYNYQETAPATPENP